MNEDMPVKWYWSYADMRIEIYEDTDDDNMVAYVPRGKTARYMWNASLISHAPEMYCLLNVLKSALEDGKGSDALCVLDFIKDIKALFGEINKREYKDDASEKVARFLLKECVSFIGSEQTQEAQQLCERINTFLEKTANMMETEK